MAATPLPPALSPTHAVRLARQAAATVGINHDQGELVRLSEHAIVRLPAGVIARVARGMAWEPAAVREVRLARALIEAGVPCVPPLPVDQPIIVDGHPVTLWEEIPGPVGKATMADFGAILRQLHAVDIPTDAPPLDPWPQTRERIENVPVTEDERQVLRNVFVEVQEAWPATSFELGSGLLHGDAHMGNIAHGSDGSVFLIDLETMCIGPREWDLIPTGVYATSLGWVSRTDYAQFVDAYGYDITASPIFPLLTRLHELRMTCWLAQYASESERIAAEVSRRVACLADPSMPRHWLTRSALS